MKYNPPAGSQDPDAKYVTGQPGKVRGSAVPAEAVEHPQREIVEVIKKAGLDPDGDDLTQLWQAIGQIISTKAPIATKKKPGLVQIGDGLAITPEGLLSVLIASTSQAGLVKPRYGLKIGKDGSLDVDFGDMPTDKFEELLKSIRVPIWLKKNTSFYVSTTGSDTLDDGRGTSAEKPFRTLSFCLQYIAENYNLGPYTVTVHLAAGDYGTTTIKLPDYQGTTGKIVIMGVDGQQSMVSIGMLYLMFDRTYDIYDVTVKRASFNGGYSGSVEADAGTINLYNVAINTDDVEFGTGYYFPLLAVYGGQIRIWSLSDESRKTGIKIMGNGTRFAGWCCARDGGLINWSADITLSGTMEFILSGVLVLNLGICSRNLSSLVNPGRLPTINAVGTFTGQRYRASANAIITTQGGGDELFPGSSAGRTDSGGQYT